MGRNIDEIIRIIDALQIIEKHNVMTPANWKPRDEVLLPPLLTKEEIKRKS
ncbi:MAG: hypothetical protein ACTSSP_02480 [Candidatus Asgardarchaeia archaeon]